MLNVDDARQIARHWNTKDERSGFAGYVLRFEVRSSFLENHRIQRAGSDRHLEYWIPAADLDDFNRQILGLIEVFETYVAQP